MYGSRVKMWIIGFLFLATIVAVAAGYMLSGRPSKRADKGTLVWEAEEGMKTACGKVKDGML